jgi:hypothetical protein
MNELEKEIGSLNEVIRQKDNRIDDLLEKIDNLAVAYQQLALNQCKCDNSETKINE